MPYRLRLCFMICVIGVSSLAFAQNEVSPLYFTANGILYEWYPGESEPVSITDHGYIHDLVHAPVGNRIAFVWHQIINRQNFTSYGYAFGEDFRGDELYIFENGELHPLDLDATLAEHIPPNSVINTPTWSVDGERFAWIQGIIVTNENTGYQSFDNTALRYFDLRDGQIYGSEDFVDGYYFSGGDAGEGYLTTPHWVAHHVATLFPGAGPEITMRLDNTAVSGEETNWLLITNVVYAGGVDVVDVTTSDGQYIGVFYEQYGQWDLLNPLSFSSEALAKDTLIEAYSPNAPHTSLVWRYNPVADAWSLYDETEIAIVSIEATFWRKPIALSSYGNAAAYVDDNTLHVIWEDGREEHLSIDGLHGLAWGPIQWRVAENVFIPDVEQTYLLSDSDCPQDDISIGSEGTLETTYYVELYAHIEPLRYVVNELPPGIPIRIIGGPRCHNRGEAGIDTWWQIETYNQVGWVLDKYIVVSDTD
ncbi:MAG: hypothetical protein OHK0046_38750 [Anaerolineae bacterium]